MLRDQPHPADAAVLLLLAAKDPALAHYAGSVFKGGLQLHVRRCHRQHPAGNGQHLTHALHRPVKAGHNAVEGCQEQIAEALSCQRPLAKAIVHQLGHQRLGIGQSLQTAADVSRRQHSQALPQPTGAAAVVRHGDNGGEVLCIQLQPPQQRGQTRSAANGGNAARAAGPQNSSRP